MQADCKLGLLDIYSWVNSDEIEMFACQESKIICPSIDFNEYVPAHANMKCIQTYHTYCSRSN